MVATPPGPATPLAPGTSDENYALRYEDVSLLDSEEAIEVLSLGGEIPEVLRQRLRKKSEQDE
jgi:hypothetical protein